METTPFTLLRSAAGKVNDFLAVRSGDPPVEVDSLLGDLRTAIDRALEVLRSTPESELLEPREVGRGRLPSTVLGLLSHAAEHAQRHTGQLITTVKVVRGGG